MTKTLTTTRLRIVYFVLFVHSYLIHFSKTQAPCAGNGLTSCACNFIKACEWDSITKTFSVFKCSKDDLDKFFPKGLNVLAKNQTKVAEICEPGSICIFYDCENRIPIASALVLTADQYNYDYGRPRYSFRYSSKIENKLQQITKTTKTLTPGFLATKPMILKVKQLTMLNIGGTEQYPMESWSQRALKNVPK